MEKDNKNSRKTSYKIIFQPEHVEEISHAYLVNQAFEYVSDVYLRSRYQKNHMPPIYVLIFDAYFFPFC